MHAPGAAQNAVTPPLVINYRPDIDGLRALAVLSVVGFHAFPDIVRSGFVGVDIFFVISGYLISSIILRELRDQRFSFTSFYARRIKRIFPSLITVLLACYVAGAVLLWPVDFALLGKHAAVGAGFVANFAFWFESGYFDVASDSKILLHLWSLGIEEQFYIVWPAFLWLVTQAKLRRFPLLAAIFAASLLYGVKTVGANPTAAFYSPVGRFWELTAGSILAFIIVETPRPAVLFERIIAKVLHFLLFVPNSNIDPDKPYRHLLSTLGAAMILLSLFIVVKREFPGWWAVLPVAGAYLIIAAGPAAWFNRFVLSNRMMVGVGLISYPLYLWHWPLLAFARLFYDGDAAPTELRAALMAAALVLAWATYQYIEKPIRFGRQRWIVPSLAYAMVLIGGFGIFAIYQEGLPGRISVDKRAYITYFARTSPAMLAEVDNIGQNQCNFSQVGVRIPTVVPRKEIDPSCYLRHSEKAVMIIGDSNAADLYYGLKTVLPQDISPLLIFSSGCQPLPVAEWQIHTQACDMANYFALQRIKIDPPDVLVLSSNNSYDINYIRKFTERVKGYGVKHVIVLGMRPHWKLALHRIVLDHFWSATPRYIQGYLDIPAMLLTWNFQSQLRPDEGFEFVDEMKAFCNEQGCITYVGDDRRAGLVTFDSAHLRPDASLWHAREHLAPLIMKHF